MGGLGLKNLKKILDVICERSPVIEWKFKKLNGLEFNFLIWNQDNLSLFKKCLVT